MACGLVSWVLQTKLMLNLIVGVSNHVRVPKRPFARKSVENILRISKGDHLPGEEQCSVDDYYRLVELDRYIHHG